MPQGPMQVKEAVIGFVEGMPETSKFNPSGL
jgi:hypothetical protein